MARSFRCSASSYRLSRCRLPLNRRIPRPPRPAPAFTAKQLTAQPRDGWITNGGNIFNQRYSPLTQINRDTVARLKPSWRVGLNGSGVASKYSGQGQPLEHDGVIYMVTGADDVFAIDVETGAMLWTYLARLDDKIDSVCCGWSSRGLALGDGKVYVGQLDGKLVALDQRTGAVVWSTQAERWQDGLTITAAPLYYDGLVITGFAGGDRATRGRLKAFSARNGSLKWTFYTIPGPGEPGHETWPQDNDSWKYGGASIWQTPAVDPELGLVYFSTSNPGPDLNGGVRAGDNLYSSSIVALDVATGRYRWHFQEVHHDLWDYDAPNPVVLFDAPIAGQNRKGIAEVGKTGFTYILDRTNGKPLIGIEERAVPQEPRQATASTQPFPLGDPIVPHEIDIAPEGFEVVNQGRIFTPFWDKPVLAKPQATGGANWPPSSYDPETHLLYVCAHDGISAYSSDGETSFMDAHAGDSLRAGNVRPRGRARARHLRGGRPHDEQARVARSSGAKCATAVRSSRRAGSCSSAATTTASRRSTRTTASCSGISRRMRPSTRPRARSSTTASSTSSCWPRARSSPARSTATACGCSRSTVSSSRRRLARRSKLRRRERARATDPLSSFPTGSGSDRLGLPRLGAPTAQGSNGSGLRGNARCGH